MKPGDFVRFTFKDVVLVGEIQSARKEICGGSEPQTIYGIRPKVRGRLGPVLGPIPESDVTLVHPGTPDFPQLNYGV